MLKSKNKILTGYEKPSKYLPSNKGEIKKAVKLIGKRVQVTMIDHSVIGGILTSTIVKLPKFNFGSSCIDRMPIRDNEIHKIQVIS